MKNFDEVFEQAYKKAGTEEKLKAEIARQEAFKKMKPKELSAKYDELEAFAKKAIAEMEAETAQLRKKREEREYYENYFKKYGNEI
ncbi:hypothetical protein M4D68_09695 [Priestia aryabhattai]|uniref:hypothetical protein n=1 Tax=Priestia aryabhattai TaxID=412384 RepID=UPI00203E0013|nr:hypothetical protein [Priestia aryabhattai]MCM3641409.1 hypothetical protein [Priestia aryabhattai]